MRMHGGRHGDSRVQAGRPLSSLLAAPGLLLGFGSGPLGRCPRGVNRAFTSSPFPPTQTDKRHLGVSRRSGRELDDTSPALTDARPVEHESAEGRAVETHSA